MTILLIVTALGALVLGYLLMRRLDNYIENGGVLDSPQGRANQGVLVYGAPDIAEKLQKNGMKCRILTTLAFPQDGLYSALFALSRDDRGNLAVCRAAKREDPGIFMVARCNAPELRETYMAVGGGRLLDAGEPIDELVAQLRGDAG